MGDPTSTTASTRTRKGVAAAAGGGAKPRWAFWKGLVAGAALEIPALALTVWVLGRLGVGNGEVAMMRVVRLTTVFAGVAALLTAGGIGRLAAYSVVEVGRKRAVIRAARAHAVASAGLVVIAAIPHGELPASSVGWLAFPAAGLVSGAVIGAIIGIVCSRQASLVNLSEVWQLARKPSVALRSLLDPDDLVRLGSALRARTTNLFEGMFEPGKPAPQPADTPADKPADKPAEPDKPPSPPGKPPEPPAGAG